MQPFEIRVPAATHDGNTLPELLLSTPTAADVDRVTEICQDPAIQAWTMVPSPYRREDAVAFIETAVEPGWASSTGATLAVREVPADGGSSVLVGMVDVRRDGGGRGEVGYWLAPEARGRGTILRAVRALIDVVLDPIGPFPVKALGWACDIHDGVPNWASWRVAWRLGFVSDGRTRAALAQGGELVDSLRATLLPTDPREPQAPWDGPAPVSPEPTGRGHGSANTQGDATPLVAQDGVGRREGDDPEALVRRFHRVYGLPIRTDGPSLDRPSLGMRMSLIAEEFAELTGAVYGRCARREVEQAYARAVAADDGTRDTVEAADALADLVYVIYGMALETGIDLAAVLTEVQRSNMSKLGEDGRPIYREDGKVLKGPGFFQPDVAGVLGLGD
ncbi:MULTISPECIES: GNAT family N-acetyltransferase [unclassified Actinomyces]|uniref:GNAT family N-acetyltransferase n=1 Tax=unclassified Actinomyces TaxID=2609248 RepID=UPI0020179703|nr:MULTISPECIES: GNAT family N-acetyltransferase [unclassified Actinomyces]MCL3777529.1 GNAT family N-acetyltransferase [Actinomyces sp. AC-20-1]MCL3790329.1 GNAT family N-acetyltransferase [Actinomyces sp. 187325]MCL3792618.1 GNAT family N-acetyltransferase [Actinomyces sp. 186855]MCL3795105.1 GNAT family N-acetyltransferase [Actinomyces sp. 217892]